MTYYQIDKNSGKAFALEKYQFKTEGSEVLSPQVIISENPEIVLDILEIEAQSDGKCLATSGEGGCS